MDLDFILFCFFIFLNAFAILGLFFKSKQKNQFNEKKFYKICPCKKMAENGILSTICIYSAVGGFTYSVLSIGLIGFVNWDINLIFLMGILSAFLGWKLKL
ncbi:hypothetical protein LNU06_02820 [Campylobacter sp. VicNov18]|uniref:hypothetical protein n=1 Tax=Campylobacter bilis TaxID=2691918 RepID=UPI001323AB5A|nr:hypothetical protein [Campylobacter bilis]MPV63578.1 hypothetical protein [Campylobacter hepaticus]MBM0637078.1 hypothetical protein [Campylobacter bilis]MCC8277764.1 hypothetical protein [Campylobacter bilis]MCC8299373.1 hypothetical protein [Campylobacter bilis]MCC8300673.1 hypothetical protein [Campylobacter bilis]